MQEKKDHLKTELQEVKLDQRFLNSETIVMLIHKLHKLNLMKRKEPKRLLSNKLLMTKRG